MFGHNYLKNVTTLALNAEACDGCQMCTKVCPQAVLVVENRKARIVRPDACMECGACAKNCQAGALTVDAGVGCAGAIINAALGRSDAPCCGPAPSGSSSSCC